MTNSIQASVDPVTGAAVARYPFRGARMTCCGMGGMMGGTGLGGLLLVLVLALAAAALVTYIVRRR